MTALIELIGGAGVALALLGGVIGWLFASGAVHVWTATFGKMLVWLADHANFSVSKFGVTLGHDFGPIFRRANNDVYNYFVAWRTGAEIEIAWSIRTLRLIWQANAEAIDWLAKETAQAFDWLNHVKLAQILKAVSAPVLLPLLLPKLLRAVLPHIRQGTVKIVHAVTHEVTHTVTRIVRRSAAVALPSPWAFPKFRRSWRELEAWRHLTGLRLRKLEGLLAASGLALAVANMTGTSFKCWRGQGNVARSLRHICGLPRHLLDDLLGILADVWILENVCVLLPYLEQGASVIGTPLVEALTEVGAGICKGSTAPGPLKGPSARLPAATPSIALSLV